MSAGPVQKALRRSLTEIRYVSAIAPGDAGGPVAAVYAQVERDFGMLAPPVALHSPAAGPLAACWVMLRETLVAAGLAGRAAKETVAAAVSQGNDCPYCVAVHGALLSGLGRGREAAGLDSGAVGSIPDGRSRDLAAWARASGQRESAAAAALPFPAGQLPELAGVAVTFQYLNRMVTVFLADSPLPAAVPAPLAGGLMRVLGRFLRSAALSSAKPGASLALLPEAAMPGDLGWAAGHPFIADAFARASAAIEAAGAHAAPPGVRDLVLSELAGWHGQPRGPGRSWADEAISGLPAAQRPAGRLALLTACAPHQVMPADITNFRRGQPRDTALGDSQLGDSQQGGPQQGDTELIELTSWASLAAARQVGSWLAEPA